MKIYTVHLKPEDAARPESAVFVPEAFCWPAIIFPFNFIWAINNRVSLFMMLIMLYFISAIFMSALPEDTSYTIGMMKLALLPFFGVFANDFWRLSLQNRGYEELAVVSGKNEAEAQLRFFTNYCSGRDEDYSINQQKLTSS